jgi:hypothetical protein
MGTLTTKFSLGDQVWTIHSSHEEIKLPCRFCRGQGWLPVEGANEAQRSVKCPECGGSALIRLGSWPEWRAEPDPLTIGQIQLRVYDRAGVDNGQRADNLNPARVAALHEDDEEGYMAWSTGVGSGTVHHAEDLFASKEEAVEEAERRTERARAGEDPGGRKDRWRKWWPDQEQVRVAAGFLDHRDIYEHDAAHVALAEAIVEVGAKRERERREARV